LPQNACDFLVKRYLPFVIISAVAALTLAAGAMLFHAKQRSVLGGNASIGAKSAVAPQHMRGASNAPVTLEEFGDFQCPACATTADLLRVVENDYGPRLRMIFWNFPLPSHRHGRQAALAAEAASLQGRFWEMHDLLYQNQANWSKEADVRPLFESYAQELHLDVERFRKDVASEEAAALVDRQREHGISRGVQNTPTLFINSRVAAPPFTPERLHEAIDAAMPGHKNS
jgi:protein-disulfide isomerase